MGSTADLFRQLLGPIWLDVAAIGGRDTLGKRAGADLPGWAAWRDRLAGVGARRGLAAAGDRTAAADRRGRDALSNAVCLHPAAQPGASAGSLQLCRAAADRAAAGARLARAPAGTLVGGRADSRSRIFCAVGAGRASF